MRKGRGEGLLLRVMEGRERRREGTERESRKARVSRINTRGTYTRRASERPVAPTVALTIAPKILACKQTNNTMSCRSLSSPALSSAIAVSAAAWFFSHFSVTNTQLNSTLFHRQTANNSKRVIHSDNCLTGRQGRHSALTDAQEID